MEMGLGKKKGGGVRLTVPTGWLPGQERPQGWRGGGVHGSCSMASLFNIIICVIQHSPFIYLCFFGRGTWAALQAGCRKPFLHAPPPSPHHHHPFSARIPATSPGHHGWCSDPPTPAPCPASSMQESLLPAHKFI